MLNALEVAAASCADAYLISAKAGKRWIQKAIKHPGAFRSDLHRLGILKGDGPIRQSHISEALRHAHKTGDQRLMRRANLARTLIRTGKKAHHKTHAAVDDLVADTLEGWFKKHKNDQEILGTFLDALDDKAHNVAKQIGVVKIIDDDYDEDFDADDDTLGESGPTLQARNGNRVTIDDDFGIDDVFKKLIALLHSSSNPKMNSFVSSLILKLR